MTADLRPAGWYRSPDPSRSDRFARYWDGSAWTDHEVELGTDLADGESAGAATANDSEPEHMPSRPHDRPSRSPSASPGAEQQRAVRLTWLPKAIIAATVALIAGALLVEQLEATGPVGYSLADETTRVNPLVNAPEIQVSRGDQTGQLRMSPRAAGALTRFRDVEWSLNEPLRIELIPAYPGEAGHVVELDLREGGANALNQGWHVRVDVVVTDQTFEVEVSQPTTSGIFRSRQPVHRVTLPRSDERVLFARLTAERELAEAERAALAEESRRIRGERAECIREETAARRDAVAPVLDLGTLYQGSLDRRRIYGTSSLTFPEYRRRITNLANDMRGHVRDAERVLGEQPQPSGGSFASTVANYDALREAWQAFEVALRTERSGAGRTFQDLYPRESGAIDRGEEALVEALARANTASSSVIRLESTALCESRHPLP